MAQILDGNRVRDEIKNECRPRVERLIARRRPPGLAVVLVGHDPASEIYVRNKVKTSHELGIHSETITPPESHYHRGTAGHRRGAEPAARDRRHPGADAAAAAGGFQARAAGRLAREGRGRLSPVQRGQSRDRPARAAVLHAGRYHRTAETLPYSIAGKRAVVVGRSDIVGKPMALHAAARKRHRNHLPFEDA